MQKFNRFYSPVRPVFYLSDWIINFTLPMRKIAITDIHGCYLSFIELLDQIAFSKTDELYLLGDYIDRGPDSKKVLDKIIRLKKEGYKMNCLVGNHDIEMKLAKLNPLNFDHWYAQWGGKETMESFDVKNLYDIEVKYWEFINSLEMYLEVDNYILVHAGLDFNNSNPLEPDPEMLFIRNWYKDINYDWLGDRYIIHGHTPTRKMDIKKMLLHFKRDRVLDIDAGCFAKHYPDKGFLCAFDMTNWKLYFQENLDDVSSYWK